MFGAVHDVGRLDDPLGVVEAVGRDGVELHSAELGDRVWSSRKGRTRRGVANLHPGSPRRAPTLAHCRTRRRFEYGVCKISCLNRLPIAAAFQDAKLLF